MRPNEEMEDTNTKQITNFETKSLLLLAMATAAGMAFYFNNQWEKLLAKIKKPTAKAEELEQFSPRKKIAANHSFNAILPEAAKSIEKIREDSLKEAAAGLPASFTEAMDADRLKKSRGNFL